MKHNKYFVELSYSVTQNDFRIFRTDTFYFTPTHEIESIWEKDEQKRVLKYISRFIRKSGSDRFIYIKQIVTDGLDENGMPKFIYPNVAFFQINNGAVVIKHWMEDYNRYASGDAYGPDKSIEKFCELLEIY